MLCLVLILALVGCGTKTANSNDIEVEKTQESSNSVLAVEESESIQTKQTDFDVVNILESSFMEKGYGVIVEHVEPEILRGERYIITLSGASEASITVYQYANKTSAKDDVLCIDKDGTTISFPDQTNYVTWKSIPHFFYQDNAIIQYVGTDEAILTILKELFGEQFAGGAL